MALSPTSSRGASTGPNTFTGNQTAPAFAASGLTGAVAASRYVGATASGAPASGTFLLGDFIIDQTGKVYICTAAGTPGTWTQAGSVFNGGTITNPLTVAPTDVAVTPLEADAPVGQTADILRAWVDKTGNGPFGLTVFKAGNATVYGGLSGMTSNAVLTAVADFRETEKGKALLETLPASGASRLTVFNGGEVVISGGSNDAGPIGLTIAGPHTTPADDGMSAGELCFWYDPTDGAPRLRLKGKSADGTLTNQTVEQASPITSGALPTATLVSGTGTQLLGARAVDAHTPVTFNPGVATTATCTVALSPDNVTYSTLAVVTLPVGVAFDGTIKDVSVRVPAGWYLKLTVNAQATLGTTTYY